MVISQWEEELLFQVNQNKSMGIATQPPGFGKACHQGSRVTATAFVSLD